MIISVHEYVLAESASADDFHDAIHAAEKRALFDIQGLAEHAFLEGIRGSRKDRFAALWIWESKDRWAELWGPEGSPVPKADYPDEWLVWEDEILDPILSADPDEIDYTAYEIIGGQTGEIIGE